MLEDGTVKAVMLRKLAGGGAAAAADAGGVNVAAVASSVDAGAGGGIGDGVVLPDEVQLTFRVHSSSPPDEYDYTCLVLTSTVPVGTFQPLPLPHVGLPDAQLTGTHATLLHGSIALNRFYGEKPTASLVHCDIITTHPRRVLYSAATAGGDSGGALLLRGKMLIAMHVEGVNDVPDDVEVMSPTATGRGSKRIKLSQASPSTVGAALRLDLQVVQDAIAAAHFHTQQHDSGGVVTT